jgi:predicted Ser/Thr protein kinase/tetratricopeptide (TPR) repeat protein
MEGKTQISSPTAIVCPTCGARYAMPRYVEGQKYGCKRCSASLFFGKFALLQELGRGGFGVVYRAWQADLERTVALKFLHSEGEETSERFVREARIAANLAHPNITAIYEVGKHEGKLYITMQFVDGTPTNRMDLGPREAAMVVRDAALAVDYAHARDIIHRDIKPHNIMVTEERSGTSAAQTSKRVFVMDFGLARSVKQGSSLTAEGQVMGTPAFMSPEQAEGSSCDARSDVYSLGATLYALITRRPPVEAETPVQVLMKVCQGAIVPPSKVLPDVDRNLEAIMLKAMARNPEDRYPTAARLAADLSMWLQGSTPDAGATVHLSASSKAVRGGGDAPRRRAGALVAVLAALLVAGAGAGAVWYLKQPAPAVADVVALVVESEPGGATVSVEGASRTWTTPASIRASELRAGPLDVTVSRAGYESVIRSGLSRPGDGKPVVLREPLRKEEPAPPPPTPAAELVLEIETVPPQATVSVGGREWKSPAKLTDQDLPPGAYTIQVSLSGYRPETRPHTVVRGQKATLSFQLVKPPAPVAFRVSSDPKGAAVFLGGSEVGVTPCEIFRDQLADGAAILELRMPGYDSVTLRKPAGEQPIDVPVVLKPQTGSFLLGGAAPRATVRAFALPAGVKNPRDLALLWSENPATIERALGAIDAADAAYVTARLAELAKRSEPGLRSAAARLASTPPAREPMKPEAVPPADATGRTRFDGAWVARRYVLLATAPGTRDFVTEDLLPEKGQELRVAADMPPLVRVQVRTRPALGAFAAVLEDGTRVPVLPGGPPLLVPAGTVVLEFTPPSDDPLLCRLSATKKVADLFDLGGNLYLLSGVAFEKDGDVPKAMRAFSKALEEKSPPPDDAERRGLPERMRTLYRAWLDGRLGKGKAVGPGARQRVEELRKDPAGATGLLLEIWSAADATRESRGAAAAALVQGHAALQQPFEAVEWLERAVREQADPGAAVAAAAGQAARGVPELSGRLQQANADLAALRKAAERKPVFLGLRVSELPERGLRVDAVARNSPALAAGFLAGEVLTEAGGAPLRTPADLDAALEKAGAGAELELKCDRMGERVTFTVKVGAAPAGTPEYLELPARVGVLQLVHRTLGTFVKLDKGAPIEAGESLLVTRSGELVGELSVEKLISPDSEYADGGAKCQPGKGAVRKGDEVRKARK